jgi:DNA-binding LacI/PurR family transcriptional regulator
MLDNEILKKPATLDDIAKLAGVDRRTVRDAIRGTGRVALTTRANVLRITRELNYVPNAVARALATGRTGRVAVLSGPLRFQYNAYTVDLLERHLSQQGYETMIVQSKAQNQSPASVTSPSVSDGVIAIGHQELSDDIISSTTIPPWVLIDTAAPSFIDHIKLDFRPAVEEALDLMLRAGRERIAYVANNWTPASGPEERRATYLEFMKKAGHTPEILNMKTEVSPDQRIEALQTYMRENGCPGALFCHNDETAIYTYRALVGLGYSIPGDVMLVGCDGIPYLAYFDTPLSTIALPMEEICEIATRFLHQRIATPDIPLQKQTVLGKLIVRKSLMP